MTEVTLSPLSLAEALEMVQMRFLLNLPAAELAADDGVRLFFQLQQAHWFYLDHLLPSARGSLPHLALPDFARALVERCPLPSLAALAPRIDALHAQFKDYMGAIPVFGAILLNARMTRVLMMRPWRGRHWVFPKGKVNEGETDIACAAREAFEEVGFDCAHLLRPDAVLSLRTGAKPVRFFIGVGAPDDGSFAYAPQSRCEVSEIGWFNVDALPDDAARPESQRFGAMLSLMRPLKAWIAAQRGGGGGGGGGGGAPALASRKKVRAGPKAGAPPQPTMPTPPAAAAAAAAAAAGLPPSSRAGGHFDEAALSGLMTPLSGGAGAGAGGGAGRGAGAAAGGAGWSVNEMFSANERLLKKTFVYDGNPHTFGDPRQRAVAAAPAPAPAPVAAAAKAAKKRPAAAAAPPAAAAAPAAPAAAASTPDSPRKRRARGATASAAAATAAAAAAAAAGDGDREDEGGRPAAAPSIHDLPALAADFPGAPFAFDMRAIIDAMGLTGSADCLAAALSAADAASAAGRADDAPGGDRCAPAGAPAETAAAAARAPDDGAAAASPEPAPAPATEPPQQVVDEIEV
jgi:mRNA-decapping enzyme subunit 2